MPEGHSEGEPDGVGPGRAGISSLISSAIFLVVFWPSDWFPVTLTVKIPAPEYRCAIGRSEDFVMDPSFQSTVTDSMVVVGDPAIEISVQRNIHPINRRLKEGQDRCVYHHDGSPRHRCSQVLREPLQGRAAAPQKSSLLQ